MFTTFYFSFLQSYKTISVGVFIIVGMALGVLAQNDTLIIRTSNASKTMTFMTLTDSVAPPDTLIALKKDSIPNPSLIVAADSPPPPPTAVIDFEASGQMGCAPYQVTFNATGYGEITGCRWDFGDGESSTKIETKHTYLNEGNFNVRLVVFRGKDSISIFKPAFISVNASPFPNFSAVRTCFCDTPAVVSFLNIPAASEASYTWLFPGAIPEKVEGFNPPEILYMHGGTYSVSLIAQTTAGCADTLTMKDYIKVATGVHFSASPAQASCPPVLIRFKDETPGCPITWDWDFGDGSPHTTARDPIHIYKESGYYDVTAKVTFDGGCIDSLRVLSAVQVSGPPISVTANPIEVCPSKPVYFTLKSRASVIFEPEPGVLRAISMRNHAQDSLIIPYVYSQSGNYSPQFTVVDTAGCTAKIKPATITVLESPKATFTAEPTFGKAPLSVFFVADTAQTDIIKYYWTFSNPKAGTLFSLRPKPEMVFRTPGDYDVQLVVKNKAECMDTLLRKKYLSAFESDIHPENTLPTVTISTANDTHHLIVLFSTLTPHTFMVEVANSNGSLVFNDMYKTEGGLKTMRIPTDPFDQGQYKITVRIDGGGIVKEQMFSKLE